MVLTDIRLMTKEGGLKAALSSDETNGLKTVTLRRRKACLPGIYRIKKVVSRSARRRWSFCFALFFVISMLPLGSATEEPSLPFSFLPSIFFSNLSSAGSR